MPLVLRVFVGSITVNESIVKTLHFIALKEGEKIFFDGSLMFSIKYIKKQIDRQNFFPTLQISDGSKSKVFAGYKLEATDEFPKMIVMKIIKPMDNCQIGDFVRIFYYFFPKL